MFKGTNSFNNANIITFCFVLFDSKVLGEKPYYISKYI